MSPPTSASGPSDPVASKSLLLTTSPMKQFGNSDRLAASTPRPDNGLEPCYRSAPVERQQAVDAVVIGSEVGGEHPGDKRHIE